MTGTIRSYSERAPEIKKTRRLLLKFTLPVQRCMRLESAQNQILARVDQRLSIQSNAEIIGQIIVPQHYIWCDRQSQGENFLRPPWQYMRRKAAVSISEKANMS